MPVRWEEKHKLQKHLYESVTEYVRLGYNQAMRQNRQYFGFLMILMQRLVTSSTQADDCHQRGYRGDTAGRGIVGSLYGSSIKCSIPFVLVGIIVVRWSPP